MKLALECPTSLLGHVQPFADFDWVLAHLVSKEEEYRKYYTESTNIKFVDNSVNELGDPLDIEELEEVFNTVGGTYVVSPDWIGDSARTLDAYSKCIKKFGEERVVAVIQGSTFEEAFRCLSVYLKFKSIVSVPYDICSRKDDPPWLMGLRRALIVSNIPGAKNVHLLGFNSLDELLFYDGRRNVMSIDTGVPVMLGLQGRDILEPLESKKDPTLSLMDQELTPDTWTAICRNIALLRRYLPK